MAGLRKVCQHRRFDGAQCVLNASHVERDVARDGEARHGYALSPRIPERVCLTAQEARVLVDNDDAALTVQYRALMDLLVAVESEMRR